MWWMKILSWLTGGFLDKALDAYRIKKTAETTDSQIAADLVKQQASLLQKEAEIQGQIIIAEQGNWMTRSIRPLMGGAAAILIWKILVWDLALGEWTNGSTDKLSEQAFWLLTTIVVAYFGGRTIEKTTSVIADAIRNRR